MTKFETICALVGAIFIAAPVALPIAVLAHGSYDWIAQGHYKDPVSNVLCCGEHDCDIIADEDLQDMPGGDVRIKSRDEVVPAFEVQQSEDGINYRCHWSDGRRRCFFRGGKSS